MDTYIIKTAHSGVGDNLRKPDSWASVAQLVGSSSKESSLPQRLFDVWEEDFSLCESPETCKLP